MSGGFFATLTGGRQCLSFDGKGPTSIAASLVCHEVRGVQLSPGERVAVSLRNSRARGSQAEQMGAVGAPVSLRGVELDATLTLRIWASETGSRQAGQRRQVGEVRLPLERLISQYGGMLYHTWLTLECAGLRDSVSTLGYLAADDGVAFDQALADAPRQLFQPKACVSVCKTDLLDASGRVLWQFDTSDEAKVVQWAPLLRSQQQHVVMSAVLHHQTGSSAGGLGGRRNTLSEAEKRCAALQATALDRQQELDAARSGLREAEVRLEAEGARAQDRDKLSDTLRARDQKGQRLQEELENLREQVLAKRRGEERASQELQVLHDRQAHEVALLRATHASAETTHSFGAGTMSAGTMQEAKMRVEVERNQAELDELRKELDVLSTEANDKIDAANERIKALRKDRDEAVLESDRLKAEGQQLLQLRDGLSEELVGLREQKEALLKIVEDLHQTCVGAGVQQAGRDSIDSVTKFRLS